ncbi:thiol-disulfide oxidoreductase DCC family protein [Streptomyces subrutilus]|uniref:thiol-disulfide oxidoreductase DCC family protein n=1 Tax=Streptomyces subrutilus TaxID=36818 RepID=UPI0033CAE924
MRTRPVLVYDGDCGFCTASATLVRRRFGSFCDVVSWQSADLDALGVRREQAEYEALWISPCGVVHGGAQAVARLLRSAGMPWRIAGAVLTLPPVRWLAHAVYRMVADNRHRLPGPAVCAAPAPRPAVRGAVNADGQEEEERGEEVELR